MSTKTAKSKSIQLVQIVDANNKPVYPKSFTKVKVFLMFKCSNGYIGTDWTEFVTVLGSVPAQEIHDHLRQYGYTEVVAAKLQTQS
jgi:hypothetical protein